MARLHVEPFQRTRDIFQRPAQHHIYAGRMGDADEKRAEEMVATGAEGNGMSDVHVVVLPRGRGRFD
jgi:hypothetical protein